MPEAPVVLADDVSLRRAAAILRGGGLVAFPTETVYGLGANALDAAAVRRIFAAKGRPATNPVIVHLADVGAVSQVASAWPDVADRLAAHFWPGPLTLVVPRHADLPAEVTAGGPTVAVRVPAHPVALALLREAGLPLAAPSANPSTRISSTLAAHVAAGLGSAVDLILDGGPCVGGIESTVVDVTVAPPRVLRPGLVAATQLAAVVGAVDSTAESDAAGPARAPGQMQQHYAPRVPLELAADGGGRRVEELRRNGVCVGWLSWSDDGGDEQLPREPAAYAAELYAALHRLDAGTYDRIVAAEPPDTPEWQAVRDRLRRAARL